MSVSFRVCFRFRVAFADGKGLEPSLLLHHPHRYACCCRDRFRPSLEAICDLRKFRCCTSSATLRLSRRDCHASSVCSSLPLSSDYLCPSLPFLTPLSPSTRSIGILSPAMPSTTSSIIMLCQKTCSVYLLNQLP